MKLYYFAHPYTCKDETEPGKYVMAGEDANFNLCCWRAGRLLLRGFNVYSPISHTHPIHKATPEFLGRHEHEMWYDLDNNFLENTNFAGIILAPGWHLSKGCVAEKEWFEKRGKEVLYYQNLVTETVVK